MTILQACTRARGVHAGALTAAHVAQYAIATRDLGRVPSNSEYESYWAVSNRTAERHRAGIRDVYGDDWRDVVEWLASEIDRRRVRAPGALVKLSPA